MSGTVGASQLAGDFAAEYRIHSNSQVVPQGRQVKAGKVKDFDVLGGFEQLFEMGGCGLSTLNPDDGNVPLGIAKLHQAQPIAVGIEPHRFGINCDRI
jgi:hypothetical protein